MIKHAEELEYIRQGGKILGEILDTLAAMVAPGVTTLAIDKKAEELILAAGGRPAFKGYRSSPEDPKFPCTICASVNEENVHGIASEKKVLKEGDIFSIDIGMQWPVNCGKGKKGNGFFTDTALTVPVGTIPENLQTLLAVTQESLFVGIEASLVGNTIRDIGRSIETFVKPHKYGIIRALTGHGVGHEVHEEPPIPNYDERALRKISILPGMVLALEPMLTLGGHEVDVKNDGWTIVTEDGSLNAHFEHTIIITEDGPEIVTLRPSEK